MYSYNQGTISAPSTNFKIKRLTWNSQTNTVTNSVDLVDSISTPHDLFSIGMGGRMKLTRRTSINVEYFYQLSQFKPTGSTDMLSIGFDIETGGHVFQLCFTNSPYMVEKAFIHQNTGSWKAGDIFGGFNLSRNFTIRDPRQSKKAKKSEW